MSTLLRALAQSIRYILHRHDPVECWCEVTEADRFRRRVETGCVYCTQWHDEPHDPWCPRSTSALPVQGAGTLCPTCWVSPGMTHELSCPEVSPEQMRAFLGGAR